MADDISNFASAIQFWRGVQLNSLQQQLDDQGQGIVANQKDGAFTRKKLAEQTREFKKLPDEDKLQQVKPMLKAYQAEIDNITKRAKYAENSFLGLYKVLSDAPDPAPLFEAAVDQSAKIIDYDAVKSENEKLKRELEEQRHLTQQLQSVEKVNQELQQKLMKLETSAEEKRIEEIQQKEQEMKQQYNDKIRSYKEKEHDLQRQLNQALDQLTQLQHTHDDAQAQLLNHNQKYDEEVIGKLAELDIVMMDLERANSRIVELERKNDDMREEIETARGPKETTEDADTQQQDAAISKLMKDVDTYKDLLQKTESRLSKKVRELSTEIKSLTEEKESLSKKLHGFDDYDEIKRELQIMKYVEFSTGDDDNFDAKALLKKDSKIEESLEIRLMEKNKRLENDFTQMKVSFIQLEKDLQEKQEMYEALRIKNTTLASLVQRLEEDLLRLGQKPISTGVSFAEELTRTPSSTNITAATSVSQSHTPDYGSPRVSYDANAPPRDDKGILPIVMSQRDRFRQRAAELEQQNKDLEVKLADVQGEVDTLKQDNLKLYERLRFVHVWKEEQKKDVANRSTSVNMAGASNVRRNSLKAREDPTDKYGKLYEESMNPFVQFHRKEETRRYNSLNPAEKLTFNLTRMLFSHKWSRYFLIIYSLLLHLLVVVTLYQLSLWECRHDHENLNLPTMNDPAISPPPPKGL